MKTRLAETEIHVYILAFLLALFMRLFQLGSAALSDLEAGWALQALGLSHGSTTVLGAQPAYIILTSQLFSIFGSSNFVARLYPALAGSLLVWLPFLLRRWMGSSSWMHRAGLVMAFGLAIDPGLVSLSRQAGSLMPALAFTLLALGCFYNRRMVWTGIFAGLALLSGMALLQGLLILGVAWALTRLVSHPHQTQSYEEASPSLMEEPVTSTSIRVALAALAATILVAGVFFLRLPQGLGGLAETLPAYLDSWVKPSGIPLLRLPASLLVYQPLLVLFAVVCAVRLFFKTSDGPDVHQAGLILGLWAVAALLLPLLYAGRQVGDMAWALIPLWGLAAIEISRSLDFEQEATTRVIAGGLSLLLFVLSVVGWINLLSIGRYQVTLVVYWAIIFGALILGVIAVLLVAATWSAQAARLGVVWALVIVLGLQLFSNTWGMAVLRPNGATELWSYSPSTGQADLLRQTLVDLSSWNTGQRDGLEIVAVGDPASAQWNSLKWELRSFPNSRFTATLSATESPPVVITLKQAETPSLAKKYRGQDFNWHVYPGWQGVYPPGFINWLGFRQAPLAQDQIILWARADIFPEGASSTSGSTAP